MLRLHRVANVVSGSFYFRPKGKRPQDRHASRPNATFSKSIFYPRGLPPSIKAIPNMQAASASPQISIAQCIASARDLIRNTVIPCHLIRNTAPPIGAILITDRPAIIGPALKLNVGPARRCELQRTLARNTVRISWVEWVKISRRPHERERGHFLTVACQLQASFVSPWQIAKRAANRATL